MDKKEIIEKQQKYLFSCVATYYDEPLVVDHAKDQYVYDADGNEYLDFFGGILTVSVGHCNDKVTRAIDEQTHKVQHMSTLYANEPQVRLAEKLAQITPGRLEKSFFTNSGTEANETAVLLAQIYTKCQDIITLRHSYSGRSYLALSLSAQSSWRLMPNVVPGVHHIANAYCYRCPFGLTYPSCDLKCAKDAEEAIQTMTSQGRVAAFLAEPIQGVGGFIVPPKEYFQEIVGIIRKYGGLFIADEVQTGWGRTGGKMFGIEHWGVDPDIMTFAKGMANGVPIGATIAVPEVADSMKGNTISTFGGNPVTCTAARATIEVVEEENLVDNARIMGNRLARRPQRAAAEVSGHRRRARHGAHAGHGAGRRKEKARRREHQARDGTDQARWPAARQGRHLRQRPACRAAAQRQQRSDRSRAESFGPIVRPIGAVKFLPGAVAKPNDSVFSTW